MIDLLPVEPSVEPEIVPALYPPARFDAVTALSARKSIPLWYNKSNRCPIFGQKIKEKPPENTKSMALPNPGMDAVPFTPLTAEFLDDMIQNIESLSSGTGFANGAITTNTLADKAVNANKIEIQQSWIAPSMLNGWTNYNTSTWDVTGYMKDSLGFVHIRGFLKGGTTNAGTIVFQLPAGYRPAKNGYFCSGYNAAGSASVWQVSSTGEVIIVAGGSTTYCSMGAIIFKAEN